MIRGRSNTAFQKTLEMSKMELAALEFFILNEWETISLYEVMAYSPLNSISTVFETLQKLIEKNLILKHRKKELNIVDKNRKGHTFYSLNSKGIEVKLIKKFYEIR